MAGTTIISELPVLFDGHPHILTDLGPQTTCDDLIYALLRFRQAVQQSPKPVLTASPADCDFYVIRHGERRRKINRNVRIQTFYRHYAQRYSTAALSFEVVASRRPQGPARAHADDPLSSSPDRESTVAFFDAEAARKEKEEQETRRHLLKTIARQSQELERLRVQLEQVEAEIAATEWKVLPSLHLPDCIAHYERLHRCNRRLLAEHAKIDELTSQLEAARASRCLPTLRRTLSDSSLMDATLDALHIPPPTAFGDAPPPCPPRRTYVNCSLPAVPRHQLAPAPTPLNAAMKHHGQYSSQPLSFPQPPGPLFIDSGGVDSDTGLGSLSDEGGACLSPVETLV